MKIKCPNPNCRDNKESIFSDRVSYARHILAVHKDDEVATEWANTTIRLAKQEQDQTEIESNPSGKSTYLGKRLDRIPPKRFGSLPNFIKRLLGIQIEEGSSE